MTVAAAADLTATNARTVTEADSAEDSAEIEVVSNKLKGKFKMTLRNVKPTMQGHIRFRPSPQETS